MTHRFQSIGSTIALCICLSAFPALMTGSSLAADETVQSATAIQVATVAETNFQRRITATGSVVPTELVNVSARSGGLAIRNVLVREGDHVASGQVLALLDTELLEAQIAEQDATVTGRRASLEVAQAAAERAEKLMSSNAISTETLESRRSDLSTAKTNLLQAEAQLASLAVQLKQATIRAPVDGVIAGPPAAVGTVAQTSTVLFEIIRDGALEVQAQVPQQYLPLVVAGQTASVTETGADGLAAAVTGTVRAIAEKVDTTTRLGIAYVTLPAGTTLRSGMFARVEFDMEPVSVLTIPEEALIWSGAKPGVFVVKDKKAKLVAIETGVRQNGSIVVSAGLAQGETVVTKGAAFLTDGADVAVVASTAGVAQ